MSHLMLVLPAVLPLVLMPLFAAQAKDLTVTAEQVGRLEIKLSDVQQAAMEAVALLPGTVVPAMNARIAAPAPFAGTVVQMHVLPGQKVRKGAALLTVASRELSDALGQLKQSEADIQVAQAVAQRKRILVDKNVSSPVVAEEAEAQVAKLRAVVDQHNRTIALGGTAIGKSGQYTITAPADGMVVETHALPGAKLDAMAAAVTIDASDELWVEVQLPSDLVRKIVIGDTIQVIDGPEGKVVSIGGSLDRLTRSATLLASVPANSGLLPGQMVTISVLRPSQTGGLNVPAAAVAWVEDKFAVFVRSAEGFNLTPITLRGRSPAGATVDGALVPGQQVAISGLPQLEAMLGKD
ncbi:MAG: efflux RND transporter periplasmic adaptor subunit [Hyphomicrobiaceae bacterium]